MPEAGYPLHAIGAAGLSRTNPIDALKAIGRVAPAMIAAGRVIDETRPTVVLGGGGYIAGIGGAAAALRRIPLVLTEADSHLGLSNRLLAPFASTVCLAFPIEGRESDRYVVTGRPVPPAVTDREAARRRFGIPPDAKCVLVTGGSLGARSINLAAVDAFADDGFHVLHLAGERDLPSLKAPREGYLLFGYVDRFGEAVAACDLAVARAGGSVFELAAHGTPAVLIPYPHAAGDHQTGNARWMADAGAAVMIDDADLNARQLGEKVRGLLDDASKLAAMARASRELARPGAAADVAEAVIEAAGRGRKRG